MKKKTTAKPSASAGRPDSSPVAVEDAPPSLVVVTDEGAGGPVQSRTGSPVLTLSQAATACATNRGALRRALSAGRFPNAYKAGDGIWRIPVDDLGAAGFDPRRWEAVELERREELRLEVDRLRTENELLRELLTATETVARERQERIDDLQFALRMLPEAWARKLKGSDGSVSEATAAEAPTEIPRSPEPSISRFGAALHALWESPDGSGDAEADGEDDDEPVVMGERTPGEAETAEVPAPRRSRRWLWPFGHRGRHRR